MFSWNQTIWQSSSSDSLEEAPTKKIVLISRDLFIVIPCWLLGLYFFSKCAQTIHLPRSLCRISSVWYQADQSRTSRILILEKWAMPSLWASSLFYVVLQQLPATFLPLYLQIISVPGHRASGSGVLASFKDDTCSSWHTRSKLVPFGDKDGSKTRGRQFYFSVFSGGHAGMCVVFLSFPSMLARFPFVRYFFPTKLIWHHLPQGAVLYLVHFPASGIT